MLKKEKKLIGWRETVSLPDLGVQSIKVKIDTGARTSAIHVKDLKIIKKGKQDYAEFVLQPKQKSVKPEIKIRAKILEYRQIRSSNGHKSLRPVIVTRLLAGSVSKEIELTLVNRDLMGFRMLLGRTALKKDFLIDASRSFLLTKLANK